MDRPRRCPSGRHYPVVLAALALAGLVSAPVAGQRLALEVKGGGAVGNYTAARSGLDVLPGPVFGAALEVWATPSVAGYVGFTRSSFGCEEGFCINRDVSYTTQGLTVGARWSPGLPWARAGLVFQGLDIEAREGGGTSGPALGIELAGGAEITVGDRVGLRPGLAYVRHGASTDLGDGHVAMLALEFSVVIGVAQF